MLGVVRAGVLPGGGGVVGRLIFGVSWLVFALGSLGGVGLVGLGGGGCGLVAVVLLLAVRGVAGDGDGVAGNADGGGAGTPAEVLLAGLEDGVIVVLHEAAGLVVAPGGSLL